MRVQIRKPTRQRNGNGHTAPRRRPPEPERTRRDNGPENREKRTGGPQDKALYSCRCGSSFMAPVTASVRCPHCGEPQAW